MTIDDQITILQAFKDRKKVEKKTFDSPEWVEVQLGHIFDFHTNEYRIAPEPFECWVVVRENKTYSSTTDINATLEWPKRFPANESYTIHHMREVP